MSTELLQPDVLPLQRLNYINHDWSVWSWVNSRDHKRIGVMYLLTITFLFFLGSVPAILIRLELLTPAPNLVSREIYNRLFTMHGVTMVFFFLVPSIPASLGNFLLPMMIGARDLAFPRMNLASYYLFL